MSENSHCKIGQVIEFRGCFWDDGWEFDGPCVVYRGAKLSGYGGNADEINNMIESALIEVTAGNAPLPQRFSENNLSEFRARGWSTRGFARRRRAWHVRIVVKIVEEAEGELGWVELERQEQQGPFNVP